MYEFQIKGEKGNFKSLNKNLIFKKNPKKGKGIDQKKPGKHKKDVEIS